jgi:hypothetical protein
MRRLRGVNLKYSQPLASILRKPVTFVPAAGEAAGPPGIPRKMYIQSIDTLGPAASPALQGKEPPLANAQRFSDLLEGNELLSPVTLGAVIDKYLLESWILVSLGDPGSEVNHS